MKKALVCGAGGFIGGHLVNRLKEEDYWVRGIDLVSNEYHDNSDEFVIGDLRDPVTCTDALDTGNGFDEVYQLAADMGGVGYIFTGDHDAVVMHNSALCNLNVLESSRKSGVGKIFYSSSACIYPEYNQMDPGKPNCSEHSAYPAAPDSEYGWEKLFSERLYLSYARNFDMQVRIARFHNIFGPQGTWTGGREKAPAAMCRKAVETPGGGAFEVWGDGTQTRSFLYISECLEAVRRLMKSTYDQPINIGSEEMISINEFAEMAILISGKDLSIRNVEGPLGVRGRNSDNQVMRQVLGWEPSMNLETGMRMTYEWIAGEVESAAGDQS